MEPELIRVSVIIPVYNGAEYFEDCMESVKNQSTNVDDDGAHWRIEMEVSIFDDASTDDTPLLIQKWATLLGNLPGFVVIHSRNESGNPRGVGYAKNRAVEQSTGKYLCFCDADDIMQLKRVVEQLKAAVTRPTAIIGSRFQRMPKDSTKSFNIWANCLSEGQLYTQIYQSFGPTLIMPTWFCHRNVYCKVNGGFNEGGKGVPEDLIFFYSHLDAGGTLHRVDKELLQYRYHPGAATFSVSELTIWDVRLRQFQVSVLSQPSWNQFTIWGAGKLGRRFFRSLKSENRKKVAQFCDIDEKKVQQKFYEPYPNPDGLRVPIVSYSDSVPPYVVCIKIEFSWDDNSPFSRFATEKNLQEGKDFFYCS